LNIQSISLIVVVKCRAEEEDKVVQTTRWSAQPSDLPFTFPTVGTATATAIEHTFLSTIMSCNSCSIDPGEECGSFEVTDIFAQRKVALVIA